MRFLVRKRSEPQVVLVSLVDVVLQLVIFFVLTSTFNLNEVSIDVSLPTADAPAASVEREITVELDGEGRIRLDGRETTREGLSNFFRAEANSNSEKMILLRADRSAPHGEVVAVLDLARANDMRRLSIAAIGGRGASAH